MDPIAARDLLRQVRILATLSDAEVDTLVACVSWRRVGAGEEVFPHLDRDGQVFFVIEGAFGARLESAAGRKVVIRQIPAGSHFGEIAALTGTPRSLTISAQTEGLLAECPGDTLLQLMKVNGAFATAVAAHLARTVVSLTDRVFELAALEVRFRIYAELLRLAAGGEHTSEGLLIRNAPTHEAIAAATGTQREAVTREMSFLGKENVLRQSKRELLILNIERLRQLLHQRAGATTSEAVDWRF